MNLDLFVDTSRKGISMAIAAQSESSLYEEIVDVNARGETASAILDKLLEQAGAQLDQIKRVLVTLGPGSFSGLRTGVAFCQGLCFSGKRELYGVSTLHALECFGYTPDIQPENIAVILKARPGYWYLRFYPQGTATELFMETEDVAKQLSSVQNLKNIVVDSAASSDELLKSVFEKMQAEIILDEGLKLNRWTPLFEKVTPSLIQEANYIQPSYFEKLKK